jgi:hypothetical protein
MRFRFIFVLTGDEKFLVLLFLPAPKYSILGSAMTKRKVEKFSVTKAVKSNARDQVGQPKPSRVLPEEKPKSEGRESKHKTKLEEYDRVRRILRRIWRVSDGQGGRSGRCLLEGEGPEGVAALVPRTSGHSVELSTE